MSVTPMDSLVYQVNLPLQTLDLINQPTLLAPIKTEDETSYSRAPDLFFDSLNSKMNGGVSKLKKKQSKPKSIKKIKEIDLYKKEDLEKIAKKHDVSLKTKEGKIKTKEQLFKSLKRKDLLKKKHRGGEITTEIPEENKVNLEEVVNSTYALAITDNYNLISIDGLGFLLSKNYEFISFDDVNNFNDLMFQIKNKDKDSYNELKNFFKYSKQRENNNSFIKNFFNKNDINNNNNKINNKK